MKSGVEIIAEERQRQITAEGFTTRHDDAHGDGSMALAAASYAMSSPPRPLQDTALDVWPWSVDEFNPKADPIRNLARAGALIAAEIDRLNRAKDEK